MYGSHYVITMVFPAQQAECRGVNRLPGQHEYRSRSHLWIVHFSLAAKRTLTLVDSCEGSGVLQVMQNPGTRMTTYWCLAWSFDNSDLSGDPRSRVRP